MTKIKVTGAMKEERFWTVQDAENKKYTCWLNSVKDVTFDIGKEYNVEIKEKEGNNGKTYLNIVAVEGFETVQRSGAGGGGRGGAWSPEREKAIAEAQAKKEAAIAVSVALNNAVAVCINFPVESCKADDQMKARIDLYHAHFLSILKKGGA